MQGENVIRGAEEQGGEIRVLYVDDDPDMLHVTARLLETEDEQISVVTETSPADGLDRLSAEWFDCVVSDYQMPEMDGVEFLKAVREEYATLPFLLFTGKGSEEVASEAISAGVTDYLRKEGGTDEYPVLAQQIRTAVERRRAVERFEGFLESAPDAMVIVDTDGVIEQVNTQTEDLFGYDREDLVGETVEMLLPERYRETHVLQREQYVEDPETRPMGADVDLYALHADGSEFPVDIALSPVRVGGRLEVMAAIRDISGRKWREEELREREERLQRQNDRLDEFASVVSHDLRNPLTVAEGSVELARRTGEVEYLDRAEDALDHMESLIDDLLTLAREGMTVEDLEPVSLPSIAKTAWTTAETEDATLEVDVDESDDVEEVADLDGEDGPELLADEGRLRQVLENLYHNSVEHGPDDVTVRVGTREDGFYVADDGPGIPADEREAVFEYGHSTSEDGNGFGLAIVESIVEAHGWDLSVADSWADGARFEVDGVEWAD